MPGPLDVLLDFTRVLNELRIQYVVVGSFASSARGLQRATRDVDILARIALDEVQLLYEKLMGRYYAIVYIATAEDTILAKLIWYEKGQRVSQQQWADVLGIIRLQGERLDRVYLKDWAAQLGLTKLLHDALVEVQ